MSSFQDHAVILIAIWLLIVAVRYRRSTIVLMGGLFAVTLYSLLEVALHRVSFDELGLSTSVSWPWTIGLAAAWLGLMLAYSPIADRIATRLFAKPPTLGAFRAIQESKLKLIGGIVVAWILGGFIEELILRGIVLQSVEAQLATLFSAPIGAGIAICVAALAACVLHLYQGPRAAVIITQLSVLFGLLFVLSGHNLWTVILCHGSYDTIAFIRFATGKSRYAKYSRGSGQQQAVTDDPSPT